MSSNEPPGTTQIGNYALESIEVSQSPMERLEEYLQSKGKRNTEQRRILLEHVFKQHDHFDADSLIEELPRKGDEGYVSRPTVYRTLNEFVDAGLLRRFELDGRSVYEHDYGYPQHDHLYCVKCGQLFEFHSEQLIKLRDQVAQDHHFRVSSHRLIINGICETCARSNRRVKRKQDLI